VNEVAERFWTKADMTGGLWSCWPWTGAVSSKGYGRFNLAGINRTASRIAWSLTNGPVPAGLQVLHTCDNPPCVNPQHLWLGTNADNAADSLAKGRQAQAAKTHCVAGHPFDEANTQIRPQGWRNCRVCRKARRRLAA
jgi:hypothetical protein